MHFRLLILLISFFDLNVCFHSSSNEVSSTYYINSKVIDENSEGICSISLPCKSLSFLLLSRFNEVSHMKKGLIYVDSGVYNCLYEHNLTNVILNITKSSLEKENPLFISVNTEKYIDCIFLGENCELFFSFFNFTFSSDSGERQKFFKCFFFFFL
jgi:hypothetical protein